MLNNFKFIESWHNVLPFFKSLNDSIVVIKYGGAAMRQGSLTSKVMDDIAFLVSMKVKIVLVHGGGPIINEWLNRVNIKPIFYNGIRMTNLPTMEVVEMVLSGKINKQLVALLNQRNVDAVGLSGKDANLLMASKMNSLVDDYVGEVRSVNLKLLKILLDSGYIPIISSIACDSLGTTYNINADSAAGFIAASLNASKLILLTDTPGIMFDIDDDSSVIHYLTVRDVQNLKSKNIIVGGMIPKVNCCIQALQQNVTSTHIIDGRIDHSLLISLLTTQKVGSVITL